MPIAKGVKQLAQNRAARHEYFIEDSIECGLALKGTEVKSLRMGRANLRDSYAAVNGGELWAYNFHISPYEKGNIYNMEPLRPKKLLAHSAEIRRLNALVMQKGYTLVPLSIYLKDGKVKLDLGVCRGKKLYDKRDDAAKRDAQRDMDRAIADKH